MFVKRHFEPLRPNRSLGGEERYEFTHGTGSVCVYDIGTLDFVKEIAVGAEPDCHATSLDNRYLYMACADGLYCIDQDSLAMVKRVDTGHVFATNVMPDGETMLLHDAFGGMLVVRGIQDMDRIHVHKKIDVLGTNTCRDTLGGKGHFIEDGRYYLCCAWEHAKVFSIDMEHDYTVETFMDADPALRMGDDMVLSRDRTKAYAACYADPSYVAVIDLAERRVIKKLRVGLGACGMTMTNDERYAVVSSDREDSISVIDTETDEVVATPSAKAGFEELGITGYIQGISVGQQDEIYVYGCSGNGAIVRFTDITGDGGWTISWPGGKLVVS